MMYVYVYMYVEYIYRREKLYSALDGACATGLTVQDSFLSCTYGLQVNSQLLGWKKRSTI